MNYERRFIKVNLVGGTGNQLFQLANAMNLSKSRKYFFILNHRRDKRQFTLDWWNIKLRTKYFFENEILEGGSENIFDRIHLKQKYIYEQHHYAPIPELGNRAEISGYFQSIKYFKGIEKDLKKYLYDNFNRTGIKDSKEDTVFIHARLGDYMDGANPKIFFTMTDDYFDRALDEMRGKVNFRRIEIVTDDLKNLPNVLPKTYARAQLIHHTNAQTAFELLMRSRNKIISNSTFSWWAAWIGEGNTVAPKKWFKETSGLKFVPEELFLEDWCAI